MVVCEGRAACGRWLRDDLTAYQDSHDLAMCTFIREDPSRIRLPLGYCLGKALDAVSRACNNVYSSKAEAGHSRSHRISLITLHTAVTSAHQP